MNFEAPTFRPRATAGYFRAGTTSPKRARNPVKPSAEKRKVNFKKGINAHENRRRRSGFGRDLSRNKKKMAIQHVRSGANKDATVESKLLPTEKKYTGSAKEKLIAFYNDHNPSKLGDVDQTLAKYAGNEEKLYLNLVHRYSVNPVVFGINTSTTPSNTIVENKFGGGGNKYTGSAKEKLIAFYADHNRSKLRGVDNVLEKYAGNEGQLFLILAKRYHVNPAIFGVGAFSNTPFTSANKITFGFLASPKAQSGGFGKSKGRSTITSLKTYAGELRISGDSEDMMECN